MSLGTAAAPSAALGKAERGIEGVRQYLSFRLADRTYAVPLARVGEITPHRDLNHLPHMPKGVEGILDLRGVSIPVINLRVRMGLPHVEGQSFKNIVILDIDGEPTGVLVDRVESVISASPEEHANPSALLSGPEGRWITGFLVFGERVVVLLDTRIVTAIHVTEARHLSALGKDLERQLDEGLKSLIALAPHKEEANHARIIPQMEAAISHTEQEMAKVLDRVEGMMGQADQAFQGLARLKQEIRLGRLTGEEATVAEIEKTAQQMQDQLFALIQSLQFQDIARQKLERVLMHVQGLQGVIGQKFRDLGQAR